MPDNLEKFSSAEKVCPKNAVEPAEVESPLVKLVKSGEISNLFKVLTGVDIPVILDPETEGAYFEHFYDKAYFKAVRFVFGSKIPENYEDLSREEVLYEAAHELMHLFQYDSDIENMLLLDMLVYEQRYSNNNIYILLAKNLLNAVLDISANASIPYKINLFSSLQKSQSSSHQLVRNLYKKHFPENNISNSLFYSSQFYEYLIMSIMDPSREIVVADEVMQEISKPVRYRGVKYDSVLDFCKNVIFQPFDILSMKELKFIFKQILLPIFNILFLLDITLLPESNSSSKSSGGNGGKSQNEGGNGGKSQNEGGNGGKSQNEGGNGGKNDRRDMEKILKILNEMKLKPAAQRAREVNRAENIRSALNLGTGEILKDAVQRDRRAQQIAEEMAENWKLLTTNESKHYELTRRLSDEGDDVDVNAFINAFTYLGGYLVTGADIFTSTAIQEVLTNDAVSINMAIAIDASGSMFIGEGDKYRVVKDMAYALALSLYFFMVSEEDAGRARFHNINFSAINFGDDAEEFSSLRIDSSDKTLNSIIQDFAKPFNGYENNSGDDKALNLVIKNMSTPRNPQGKKQVNLCFYMTDGGTRVPEKLKKSAKEYIATGGILIPIQIDQTLKNREKLLFNEVFGSSGKQVSELGDIPRIISDSIRRVVNE